MSFMVILIIDNVDDMPLILDAWDSLGVKGATILESTGMGRVFKQGLRDDTPLMPTLANFFGVREEPHRTVFAVVDDETIVDRMIDSARRIIGDLDEPHTGFMFVVPVIKAFGLGRKD